MSRHARIAIVGGGICGLSAAYHLDRIIRTKDRAWEARLFEEAPLLGGVIRTEIRDGFVMDLGPDALFKAKPAAENLAREIGLGDELVSALPQKKPTMIYFRGRLHPLPEGLELMAPTRILPLLGSGLLSSSGKLRMLMEPFIPARRDGTEESIAQFVSRRFGPEALERIAGPLLAGIHAGDPARLSMTGTFPRLPEMERAHGSIARAIQKARSANRTQPSGGAAPKGPPFLSLRRGLGALVKRLESSVERVRLETGRGVRILEKDGRGFRLRLLDGSSWEADACVLCLPAGPAAAVLSELDPGAARLAEGVRYASTAAAYLAYRDGESGFRLPPTSGFLIPPGEDTATFGCTFVSNKFPGRTPDGFFLIRAFLGGDLHLGAMELSDDQMIGSVRETLRKILGLWQEPLFTKIQRWPRSNPQYEVGHAGRVRALFARLKAFPGLVLTGSGFLGVGVPDGVALGQAAAREADAFLAGA